MEITPLIELPVARVVVDVPAHALSEPYDYAIPPQLAEAAVIGVPVLVRLRGRPVVGYVVERTAESAYPELKEVEAVLGTPLFDATAIDLAMWIAHEYVAPLTEALRLFLPPGGSPAVIAEKDAPSGWRLERRQLAARSETVVALTEAGGAFVPRASATAQRAVLDALRSGPLTTAELTARFGPVTAVVARLRTLGVVTTHPRRLYRRPGSLGPLRDVGRPTLTAEQSAACDVIEGRVRSGGGVVVLEGVTGSGKTEVYLTAIERVLHAGGAAIVLVPEISLTPQTVARFRARLGDDVAVLHSRLSDGERFDQWQLALEGRVRVVVGARSALFAPLPDVRLVVIDEEHEPSYKQSSTPRYHTRDVAVRLCAAREAVLVLGSATPSMETRHAVLSRGWEHVRLVERPTGGARPPVTVVDMAAEFADGHRSMYSRPLLAALAGVRDRHEKAVLFLNRRGFASFLLCRECGFVPTCDACSVSLTYHEAGMRLVCHHCGKHSPVPQTCPSCTSAFLRKFGAGTQRAETDLVQALPGLPIVRMDADTTRGKGAHERALLAFDSLDSGVLLGTQMIAKGLDFPEITLVGVLNADTSMHMPDFRASERTYQLLEQVAGRAGRSARGGAVIIQTYWPDHPAIAAVEGNAAARLYDAEVEARRELGYPPFTRLASIVVTGPAERAVQTHAESLHDTLTGALPAPGWEVIGPAPAPIARIKGLYRWHLLLKAPPGAPVGEIASAIHRVKPPVGVHATVDVDPASLL